MNEVSPRYHEINGKPTFHLGDKVKIVDTPCYDCTFSWVGSMSRLCGTEAVITGLHWSKGHKCYAYSIDADDGTHVWCVNCFEGVQSDLEESDSDINMLFGGALV